MVGRSRARRAYRRAHQPSEDRGHHHGLRHLRDHRGAAGVGPTDRGTERAIRATLQTLAEHVTGEEARQVAGLLPAGRTVMRLRGAR